MRYGLFLAAMLVAALAAIVRPAYSPKEPAAPAAAAGEVPARLDTALAGRFAWRSLPGVSVAVIRKGVPPILWTAGRADLLTGRPVTPQTPFEGASLSKPLTAYAAARLARQGRLDLDAPISRAGHTFTLRQALSHTAGFDNALSDHPEPTGPAGRFAYAGAGFQFVGQAIEAATGQTFADHMNREVLPALGMTHSRFGGPQPADLARPSVDVALPFAVAALVAAVVGLPLLGGHAHFVRLARPRRRALRTWPPRLIVAAALAAGIGATARMAGPANPAIAAAVAALVAVAGAAAILAARRGAWPKLSAAALALAVVATLALRPPLPMALRKPTALPAAGLITTPQDYARFLHELIDPQTIDPAIAAEMLKPLVRANATNAWGLGVGLQTQPQPAVWHWGLNYPGYQALAVAWPRTGDVMVVMTNGGAMSLAPGGYRQSGLELARGAVVAVEGGPQGTFWAGLP
ncbi:MAG: serine hydrolase [Phenylobacterium sp.]|uniref:serine hydrolase domain-containing protein n=1 Tax=Phenylobacterium sp. TaxID=1871053 RepID=UPI0025E43FE6|nr:serine hydrolase domain-containing protein [Phenylobacterium sp.]MBI1196569.1 serine hydrolase [Phenylobacterium sp.]